MEIYIRNIYTITEYMAYHAWEETPPVAPFTNMV